MTEIIITAAIFLIGGVIIASCFWACYMKARDEGYRRGYQQAQQEQDMKEAAAFMARLDVERKYHNALMDGFPSADPMVPAKPLGFEQKVQA